MHAAALVLVPEGTDDIREAVSALMAPHQGTWDPETEDYGGWWDWWRIGGRWDGNIIGAERLSEDSHYSDAWETLERNAVPVEMAAEYATYTVVTVNGFQHREIRNPDWDGTWEDDSPPYEIPNPAFMEWRCRELMAHRGGTAVVVDYHR